MLPTGGLNLEFMDREDGPRPHDRLVAVLATARGNAFVTPEWYLAATGHFTPGALPRWWSLAIVTGLRSRTTRRRDA